MEVTENELHWHAFDRVFLTWPQEVIRAKIPGMVRVHVTVSEAGLVIKASASGSPPFFNQENLKAAAEHAALQWRFHPFTSKGTPVRVRGVITFKIEFRDKS